MTTPPPSEPAHWTLQYLLDRGYQVTIACAAGHAHEIDLGRAIARVGDLPMPEGRGALLRAWRCRQCGKAGASSILVPHEGF